MGFVDGQGNDSQKTNERSTGAPNSYLLLYLIMDNRQNDAFEELQEFK